MQSYDLNTPDLEVHYAINGGEHMMSLVFHSSGSAECFHLKKAELQFALQEYARKKEELKSKNVSKNVSDFLVLEEMSKQKADIKAFVDCVEIKKVRMGGHITMGLDGNTAEILLAEAGKSMMTNEPAKHSVVLYVVDMEVFNQLKSSMQK